MDYNNPAISLETTSNGYLLIANPHFWDQCFDVNTNTVDNSRK